MYGFRDGKALPFEGGDSFLIAQKNGRFQDVRIAITDVLFDKGMNVCSLPYKERRQILETYVKQNSIVHLAEVRVVKTREEAEAWFRDRLEKGYEGLILKEPNSSYVPQSRSPSWIKMKNSDTFDCVLMGLFKKDKFHSLLLGVYVDGQLKTVGKCASNNFVRTTLQQMPELKTGEDDKVIWLKPCIVVEVEAQELVESPEYSSGYALRFPRFVKLNPNKKAKECVLP